MLPAGELEISLMTTLFVLARPARPICANLLEPGCSGVKGDHKMVQEVKEGHSFREGESELYPVGAC